MDPLPFPVDPAELRATIGTLGEERDTYLRAVVTQGAEALASELAQGKSERLVGYLDFAARFYRYSAHNQALIAAQCPEATFVAAYRRWQDLGYQVKRGERGIRIWAPRPYTETDEVTSEVLRFGIYFIVVVVFDVGQVEPMTGRRVQPIPTFFEALGEDAARLADQLQEVVERAGITVRIEEGMGAVQGSSHGGTITLQAGLEGTNRLLTLLHEYAHELLHQQGDRMGLPRAIKECEAEAVSYIVARHYGIHNPFASDYLQDWGNTGADLMAQLEAIQRASAQIIMELVGPMEHSTDPSPITNPDTPITQPMDRAKKPGRRPRKAVMGDQEGTSRMRRHKHRQPSA